MRGIKIYLVVVSVLLIIAIGFGVYVWYMLQTIGQQQFELNTQYESESIQEGVRTNTPSSDELESAETAVEEPIIIEVDSLSDSQRSILESFGYSSERITITPAMVECAKDAVGEERLNEILNGSAPSPLESVKLLPCMK